MADSDLKSTLAAFISAELLGGENVDNDDELLAEGMIDSIGIMRLVAFIEESIGVKVPPEDFTIDNFASINDINNFILKQLKTAPQTGTQNSETL